MYLEKAVGKIVKLESLKKKFKNLPTSQYFELNLGPSVITIFNKMSLVFMSCFAVSFVYEIINSGCFIVRERNNLYMKTRAFYTSLFWRNLFVSVDEYCSFDSENQRPGTVPVLTFPLKMFHFKVFKPGTNRLTIMCVNLIQMLHSNHYCGMYAMWYAIIYSLYSI